MIYRTGEKVVVYEDPYTKQKPEGEAILRELYRENGLESYWRVEFINEPGVYYERTIIFQEGDKIEAEATDTAD